MAVQALIADLIQKLHEDTLDIREQAAGWSGLLLEKEASSSPQVDAYKNLLPPNMLDIYLSEAEQIAIIQALSVGITSPKITIGMIWALGKARPEFALEPLLLSISNYKGPFDEPILWQMLISLDNLTFRSENTQEMQWQRQLVERYNIPFWLRSVIAMDSNLICEQRTRELAQWILDVIEGAISES